MSYIFVACEVKQAKQQQIYTKRTFAENYAREYFFLFLYEKNTCIMKVAFYNKSETGRNEMVEFIHFSNT